MMAQVYEVAHQIRELLNSGALRERDQLPPVLDLAREYGCPPTVVVRALGILKGERRLYAVRGRGHYVMDEETRTKLYEIRMMETMTGELIRLVADGTMEPGFRLAPLAQLALNYGVPYRTAAGIIRGLAIRGILAAGPGDFRVAPNGPRIARGALGAP
jgi:DNA-binding transcriptional regulator YhcF (GntR family)